jgi:hypothetical protein
MALRIEDEVNAWLDQASTNLIEAVQQGRALLCEGVTS